MLERTLWGGVYALAIFWICTGQPWSPYLLSLPLACILWELYQMKALKGVVKLASFSYVMLAGWSVYTFIEHLTSVANFFLLMLFVLIWISDSMAYVGGRLFGRTPLVPKLSPNKTWEGALIGGLSTWGLGLWLLLSLHGPTARLSEPTSWPTYAWMLPAVIAFSAPIGDLVGSKIKRLAGVKDSGVFLPGHGGFLDRFDSFLLSIILVSLFHSQIIIA